MERCTVIDLPLHYAEAINDAGTGVGINGEWNGGTLIEFPMGFGGVAINNAGTVVGSLGDQAAEWSGGTVIDLGGLPGSTASEAYAVNDAGTAVGVSIFANGAEYATEWSDGDIIKLGGFPRSVGSVAYGINDAGQIVGVSSVIPEPSTWAMMLLSFAGLGYAGYRRARAGRTGFAA